jgi:glutamyl-tRNA reductase
VSANLDARRSAVAQAEAIIDTQVGQFMHWMRSRENVPLIRALRSRADDARRAELERALKALARGEEPRQVLDALSQGLVNKLLHAPTQVLHDTTGEEHRALAELLARLYRLQ